MEKRELRSDPREQSEEITEGENEPHFIGKKSGAVLQMEFFSLMNTKEAFRDDKWKKDWKTLIKNILYLKDGDKILSSFNSKYGYLGRIPA